MCKNPKAKHAFEAQKKLSDTPERGGGGRDEANNLEPVQVADLTNWIKGS